MSRQASPSTVDHARGARLLAARKRAGLEQQGVAETLGVTRGTLRRWERGYWVPRAALQQLATLYGESLDLPPGEPAVSAPAPGAAGVHSVSSRRHLAGDAPPSTDWPQFAREAWAELYVELVRGGWDEGTIAFLRGFVLAPDLRFIHSSPDELRLDVAAGVAAARAWVAARTRENV